MSFSQPHFWAFSTFEQLFPVIVHLFLCLAIDEKRYCLGEFENRPTVQRDEFLPSSWNATVITVPSGLPETSAPSSP